ncbi:MAG: hypothetical protein IKP43_06335 [Bacteroidaceae bacterium]|nr:hypothetical protein [Bacteroidaceae bacterium]
MAKKKENPADMSVESKLKTLFQLQTLLTEIDDIKTLRGELPLEVEDLEDEIEGLRTRIEKATADANNLRREINGFKNTFEIDKSKVDNYKKQLDTVRSNRDYDVLNREIEYVSSDMELCTKRIKEYQELLAEKENAIAMNQKNLEERNKDLDIKKNELDDIIAETKADEEKLREKAKDLELNIEERLLTSFKRIRKNTHNGLGIVYVHRDSCGGCFAKIPPQRQLDVRMRKKIIVCEYCGRILIDPELAGVKPNVPVEEKKTKRRRSAPRKAAETKAAETQTEPQEEE